MIFPMNILQYLYQTGNAHKTNQTSKGIRTTIASEDTITMPPMLFGSTFRSAAIIKFSNATGIEAIIITTPASIPVSPNTYITQRPEIPPNTKRAEA